MAKKSKPVEWSNLDRLPKSPRPPEDSAFITQKCGGCGRDFKKHKKYFRMIVYCQYCDYGQILMG
jgi:DNA-directed RNA polymerase subunit RPC12/RpoP